MSIIGIDQSLTGTGLSEIDNDGNLLRSKLVKTAKYSGVQRLEYITNEILLFCSDMKERFVMAREGYAFGAKGRATFSLGELGGSIDLTLYRNYYQKNPLFVSYFVVPPNVAKKFCLGSGGIKKDSSYLLKVFNKTKMEFSDDNQADAYLIARTLRGYLMAIRGGEEKKSAFFDALSVEEKESLIGKSMKDKSLGLTKAKLKTLDYVEYAKCVSFDLTNCLVFKQGAQNGSQK